MPGDGYRADDLAARDIDAYLERHRNKSWLRFITCGSVDDGKSTLIGRLLYDSKVVFDDQLAALVADSKRLGTQGQEIDFALLVDGLAAEREQGITIDVAYRYFSTDTRKFIVADTPGHEQYTRNMVTGASTADLAVLLVDARRGVLTQTRRHSFLVKLIGLRHVVLAINKMDLVGYSEEVFTRIVDAYREFAESVGIDAFVSIPISGLRGDNITQRSVRMPWYGGPTLMEHLGAVDVEESADSSARLRLPVQWVCRPNLDFRGFAGTVAEGSVAPGDAVRVLPSGRTTTVARVVTADGDLARATAGQAVTLTLADEVDCSRGDVIAAADAPPEVSDALRATLVWMSEEPLVPGRSYWLKIGTTTVPATVSRPHHQVDVNTLERVAVETFSLNSIGDVDVTLGRAVPFAPYDESRELGGFLLIDRATHATVAAGLVRRSTRRATNVHWHPTDVTRADRATRLGQRPRVAWLTGLSGAGKSTIANLVERRLHALGRHAYLLDGDNVRHGLCRDLGFTDADRAENVRRVGEVARLMSDAGLIVITAFISPFASERDAVRGLLPDGDFVEVFVDAPLDTAEARDPKGLYKKARAGQLPSFTGIDSPYEPPARPELHLDTTKLSAEECAEAIVARLLEGDTRGLPCARRRPRRRASHAGSDARRSSSPASSRSRWVRNDSTQTRSTNLPCTSVPLRCTRWRALVVASHARLRASRAAPSSPGRTSRKANSDSCGSATISTSGIRLTCSHAHRASSSFSSSARRKAATPCSLSGSHTLRPRKSRDSSGDSSEKSTAPGSPGASGK